MGARSDFKGHIQADITIQPDTQESRDHTLVRLRKAGGTPAGTSTINGTTASVSILQLTGFDDYNVVAGPDSNGDGTLDPARIRQPRRSGS